MTNHVRIRYIFTAILLPFIWENVEAKEPQKVTQSETKFHVTLDYHYNFGLATKEKWWNNGERLGGHSLHLTALYYPSRLQHHPHLWNLPLQPNYQNSERLSLHQPRIWLLRQRSHIFRMDVGLRNRLHKNVPETFRVEFPDRI